MKKNIGNKFDIPELGDSKVIDTILEDDNFITTLSGNFGIDLDNEDLGLKYTLYGITSGYFNEKKDDKEEFVPKPIAISINGISYCFCGVSNNKLTELELKELEQISDFNVWSLDGRTMVDIKGIALLTPLPSRKVSEEKISDYFYGRNF
jgi:hypothetical protein